MPHAIEYDRLGGPEVLEYREIPYELPGPGELDRGLADGAARP